ncbi:hypothetical protein EIP91_004420 [Steccherinum ochraceum]|uniref:Alpha/beta hydrolase fold-3 domain-containing protein n=1 Tax=Steccherinum ochraceum TaxID=92696 RepID=A0A4R0RWI0_9APHY|nr:hypothetical protein EIP91_004420 [Steccherinum ochraceum]
MSHNAQYSVPDPEWATIVAATPEDAHELTADDPEALRATIREVFIGPGKRHLEPQLPEANTYSVETSNVPHADGTMSRIRVISPLPKSVESPVGCIVWIHGGAFVGGNFEFDDYRIFPISHHDAYDGIKWIADNARDHGIDLTRGFILGGSSAGGNIAASLAHRVQNDAFFEGRRLTGSILVVPPVIHPHGYPAEFRDELQSINMPEGSQWTVWDRRMTIEMFGTVSVLPPTYLLIAGLDVLRDEGILYERLIREAGVKTRLTILHLSASKKFEQDLQDGVAWLLSLQEPK